MVTSGEPRFPVSLFLQVFADNFPYFEIQEKQGEAAMRIIMGTFPCIHSIKLLSAEIEAYLKPTTKSQVSRFREMNDELLQEPFVSFKYYKNFTFLD